MDVTENANPLVDIWDYVLNLVKENIVIEYVYENNLVEKVYRNLANTFDHVLLPTSDKNIFIVIVIDLKNVSVSGHYKLNLIKEYGLN